jgi:hypothetical protein
LVLRSQGAYPCHIRLRDGDFIDTAKKEKKKKRPEYPDYELGHFLEISAWFGLPQKAFGQVFDGCLSIGEAHERSDLGRIPTYISKKRGRS